MLSQPITKPLPTITIASPSDTPLYDVPAILSKGNGKSRLILDDDDVPLALMKK